MRICRPWITVRGKRIYAHQHGLKAFCFDVDEEKPAKQADLFSVVQPTDNPEDTDDPVKH